MEEMCIKGIRVHIFEWTNDLYISDQHRIQRASFILLKGVVWMYSRIDWLYFGRAAATKDRQQETMILTGRNNTTSDTVGQLEGARADAMEWIDAKYVAEHSDWVAAVNLVIWFGFFWDISFGLGIGQG